MAQSDYDDLQKSDIKTINISDTSNIWRKAELKNIYTPATALDYIVDAYPIRRNAIDSLNIKRLIVPNLSIDKNKSDLALDELLKNITSSSGMVQTGERIIDRGEIVKYEQFKILNSLKKEYLQHAPE